MASRIARETRAARLLATGAWIFAARATMAKGPAGLVVPIAAVVVDAVARRSVRSLIRLDVITGALVALALVAPWYVAAFARHGRVFTDELVFRHMLGRTLDHLHDTNDGEDVGVAYFVKQLGYATFPWGGLALAAVFGAPSEEKGGRRSLARTLLFGASIASFALVSWMRTKFHHYCLVAVPPLAALVGLWIDESLSIATSGRGRLRGARILAVAIGASCLALLVGREFTTAAGAAPSGAAHVIHLMTYRYTRRWVSVESLGPVLAALAGLSAVALAALSIRAWRSRAAAALAVFGVAFSAFVLDVYMVRASSDGGQRGVIEAYYRARGTRAGTSPPLIAYQLNWKGENFYTGNNLAIFVQSGAPMRAYLEGRRDAKEHTAYFVAETGRVAGLRTELGAVRRFDTLTDASTSAEFCLVRAELY